MVRGLQGLNDGQADSHVGAVKPVEGNGIPALRRGKNRPAGLSSGTTGSVHTCQQTQSFDSINHFLSILPLVRPSSI